MAGYFVEQFAEHHREARERFDCGIEVLNRYLRQQATQDIKNRVAATFVLMDDERTGILGYYYSLSATSIRLCDIPHDVAKKLPKYPHLPATLLGRLAVDRRHRRRGLGEHLLLDALDRSLQGAKTIGSMAVVVDAKDENARRFYLRYDFIQFPEFLCRLFLPMKTVERLVRVT